MKNPFFRYYGAKFQCAPKYPAPKHKKIIEPFAGAAGYSTRYYKHDVELYDTYDVIHGIWSFLIRSSPEDIMRLPVMRATDRVSDMKCCEEARGLLGMYCASGISSPQNNISSWNIKQKYFWNEKHRARIARMVPLIKHWRVFNRPYYDAPNEKATWFIDPPYQKWGFRYVKNKVNYYYLAEWCAQRKGQYIVCEQHGADWLPFEPFRSIDTGAGRVSREVIFTNSFDD